MSPEIKTGINYYFENLQEDKKEYRAKLKQSQEWQDIVEFTTELLRDRSLIQGEFASLLNSLEVTLETEE